MRLPLVVEAFDATMDGLLEVIGVGEGSIGEMVLLEVAPTMLDGVELGRVLGQPLQREPRPRSECLGRELAGMDRTIVHDNDQRLDAFFLAIDQAEIIEQADKVGRALGGAGADKKPGADWVEGAQHGAAPSLSRRLDAQVGAALGPTMGQVGMGACLRRVEEKEVDHPRGGLAPLSSSSRRRPAAMASASWRPFRVCRGRRQANPFGAAVPRARRCRWPARRGAGSPP